MIRGKYVFSQDGIVVGEMPNIITSDGKNIIAKYLAGIVDSYAGAIALGVGSTAAAITDKTLEFEFARSPIVVRNVTGPSSEIYQVSFKATLAEQVSGAIRESAIISQTFNASSGSYADRALANFSINEGWVTLSSSNVALTYESLGYDTALDSVRIGAESIRFKASSASSPNIHIETPFIQGDLSGYSSQDQFALGVSALYVSTGTSVQLRFYSDADSYWFITLNPTAKTTGTNWAYQIMKFSKDAFSQSGSPDWSNITKTSVVFSTDNASTDMIIDGLSIFDTDHINADYVMTSRAVAATPVMKEAGKTMDVEYFLEFKL